MSVETMGGMYERAAREARIERVKTALRNEGLTENGGNPHTWRCEHPDRYPDYCTCVTDIATAIVDTLTPERNPR